MRVYACTIRSPLTPDVFFGDLFQADNAVQARDKCIAAFLAPIDPCCVATPYEQRSMAKLADNQRKAHELWHAGKLECHARISQSKAYRLA